MAPECHRDHAIGGGKAALEAMLGEQDGDPPLLVEAAQQPDQLVAGDRVKLGGGLVEEDEAGPGDKGGGERDALQLAAGEGVDGATEEVGDGEGEGDLLDGAGARGRGVAAHLQRQLDLRRNGGRDDLGLGVLGHVADRGRQLTWSGGDRVEPGDVDLAGDLPAVEVRDEAAGSAQEGRLARGGATGEDGELAGVEVEGDIEQSLVLGVWVAVGEPLDREGGGGRRRARQLRHAMPSGVGGTPGGAAWCARGGATRLAAQRSQAAEQDESRQRKGERTDAQPNRRVGVKGVGPERLGGDRGDEDEWRRSRKSDASWRERSLRRFAFGASSA